MPPPMLLIVEDNEEDLFLLKRAFERARVTNPVQSVRSGAEMTKYLSGPRPLSRPGRRHAVQGLILFWTCI